MPSSERRAAGLTAKGLDARSRAMLAITNQGVDMSVSDAGGEALAVRTGETFCVYPLRGSPPAFDLAPRAHRERRRFHNRREGGGEATDGAIVRGTRRCRRRWIGVRLTATDWAGP
jgi:hypothetical protein